MTHVKMSVNRSEQTKKSKILTGKDERQALQDENQPQTSQL